MKNNIDNNNDTSRDVNVDISIDFIPQNLRTMMDIFMVRYNVG